ncbi:MAG TPA: hypothetical protein VK826_03040, partial [Bacteroidia bacterium]|nr:hypothetical protein [Bacteroidia bacterium]
MRLLLALILLPSLLPAQSVSVQPERFLTDQRQRDAVMPAPAFTINSTDTSLFGAGNQPQFILPIAKGQHGFVFIGSPYIPPGYAPEQFCLIYFTDIGQPGMRAYVDRNFNYNYTDDGSPFSSEGDGVIAVELTFPQNQAVHKLRYTLLGNKMDIRNVRVDLFENSSLYSGVKLLDKNFWLSFEPLWIKGKDVVIGNDSLCVTFFDQDADGCFTGAQDRIALLPYGADSAYTSKYQGGVRTLEPGLILG